MQSWPHWALTEILIDPNQVARVGEAGWSGTHHHDRSTGDRIVGTHQGLGFGVDDSWGNPAQVIPWTEVDAIARAVPDPVHKDLGEFRHRWRAHQSAYPRFAASGAAVGCGPIEAGKPLTARQQAYIRELDAFNASGVLPTWDQQRAVLEAERLALHERALAHQDDGEARDLLDLLEEQDRTRPAVAPTDPTSSIEENHGPSPVAGIARGQDVGALSHGKAEKRPGLVPPSPRLPNQSGIHTATSGRSARPEIAR